MFQCPTPIINIPPAPPNHEWLKVLATAGLGFIVGAVLEPVKSAIQRRSDVRTILRAIYTDLRRLLFVAVIAEERHLYPQQFWKNFQLPAYTHFYEAKRELFFREPKLSVLGMQCADILRFVDAVREDNDNDPGNYRILATKLEEAIGDKNLAEQFRKASRPDSDGEVQHSS